MVQFYANNVAGINDQHFLRKAGKQQLEFNWDNTNFGVFIFKFLNKTTNFVHIIHHQFVHFINPQKPVPGLKNNFV